MTSNDLGASIARQLRDQADMTRPITPATVFPRLPTLPGLAHGARLASDAEIAAVREAIANGSPTVLDGQPCVITAQPEALAEVAALAELVRCANVDEIEADKIYNRKDNEYASNAEQVAYLQRAAMLGYLRAITMHLTGMGAPTDGE